MYLRDPNHPSGAQSDDAQCMIARVWGKDNRQRLQLLVQQANLKGFVTHLHGNDVPTTWTLDCPACMTFLGHECGLGPKAPNCCWYVFVVVFNSCCVVVGHFSVMSLFLHAGYVLHLVINGNKRSTTRDYVITPTSYH